MLTKKRWISLCLAAVLVICCLPVFPVQAADLRGDCGINATWEYSSWNKTLYIKGTGDMADYTGSNHCPWFAHRGNIEKIVISDEITHIGDYAFRNCAIKEITIPDSVVSIGAYAFRTCESLKNVYIGDNVWSIGERAFSWCTSLYQITIPLQTKYIGANAFYDNTALYNVTYGGTESNWKAIKFREGNSKLLNAIFKYGVSGTCGENLQWVAGAGSIRITGTGPMDNYEGKKAPWDEVSGVSFDTVYIDEGVTSVGAKAFRQRSVDFVSLPSTLEVIEADAFTGDMTVYAFGKQIQIAEGAFYNGRIEFCILQWDEWDRTVKIGNSVNWRGLTPMLAAPKKVYAPGTEIDIDDYTFMVTCNLKQARLYVPSTVEVGAYDNSVCTVNKVDVIADGVTLQHRYYVTDGQEHLNAVEVDVPAAIIYSDKEKWSNDAQVSVTLGGNNLVEDVDYILTYANTDRVGLDASVTVKGIGMFDGFEKTVTYAILKRDMSTFAKLTGGGGSFVGEPVMSSVHPVGEYSMSFSEKEYAVIGGPHINAGTYQTPVAGTGPYYGMLMGTSGIYHRSVQQTFQLNGTYCGQADGELSTDWPIDEEWVSPGEIMVQVNGTNVYSIYHQLMEVTEEGLIPLVTQTTEYPNNKDFTFDTSHVYEDYADVGGAVYYLVTSWMETDLEVYGSQVLFYVPAKVPTATEAEIKVLENDGDYSREYFWAEATEGEIGNGKWSVSDSSVATMDRGVLTLHKPGTVTVTGVFEGVTVKKQVTVDALDLRDATLIQWHSDGLVEFAQDLILLRKNTDYQVVRTEADGVITVAVHGCGLFTGQLLRQYDAQTGEQIGHTHSFAYACASKCEDCDFTKEAPHTLGSKWIRDAEGHWHVCTLCGEQQDYEAHTFTDPDTCGICGRLNLPGDMNNDYEVTDADAVYLLRHTLFEESYPITRNGDFNGDSAVTDADAIYLLRHTLFGDSYPIA